MCIHRQKVINGKTKEKNNDFVTQKLFEIVVPVDAMRSICPSITYISAIGRVQRSTPLKPSAQRILPSKYVLKASESNFAQSGEGKESFLSSPYDQEIFRIALPALCSGLTTPLATAVDTGKLSFLKLSLIRIGSGHWSIGDTAAQWFGCGCLCLYVPFQYLSFLPSFNHTRRCQSQCS